MQQVRSMNFGEGIIGPAAGAAIGWLVSSLTKVSKKDFEKVVVRLESLEKDVAGRMTRTDFDTAFGEVKTMVREFRLEARAEFKELKSELKSKT